jgi:RNA polymerase sigma-70 factor (ECF subfamily)
MKEDMQYHNEEDLNRIQTEQFLHLLLANQRRIFAFILSLVPNRSDADDILQETITVMWRKFGQYQMGTDFVAWGVTVSKYRILKFRKEKGTSKILFSEKTMDLLQQESSGFVGMMDNHLHALRICVKKLCDSDLKLIQMRYEQDLAIQKIADRFGRSVQAVYKSIARIHCILARCIRRTLVLEDII